MRTNAVTPAGEAHASATLPILDVTYYTDPLCCWSWAFEPVWRRLRYALDGRLRWRYRMGGMIADWSHYSDPLNDVAAPAHVGPQWMEVSRMSGMRIEPRVWHDDPPASSYPACVAVKAAEQQGTVLGDRYLRAVREAVMLHNCNVARREVLDDIARALASDGFDASAFQCALDDGSALDALRADLLDVRYHDIGRFPTLVIRSPGRAAAIVTGYRPFDALAATIDEVTGGAYQIGNARACPDAYASYWRYQVGSLTERELREACGAHQPRRSA